MMIPGGFVDTISTGKIGPLSTVWGGKVSAWKDKDGDWVETGRLASVDLLGSIVRKMWLLMVPQSIRYWRWSHSFGGETSFEGGVPLKDSKSILGSARHSGTKSNSASKIAHRLIDAWEDLAKWPANGTRRWFEWLDLFECSSEQAGLRNSDNGSISPISQRKMTKHGLIMVDLKSAHGSPLCVSHRPRWPPTCHLRFAHLFRRLSQHDSWWTYCNICNDSLVFLGGSSNAGEIPIFIYQIPRLLGGILVLELLKFTNCAGFKHTNRGWISFQSWILKTACNGNGTRWSLPCRTRHDSGAAGHVWLWDEESPPRTIQNGSNNVKQKKRLSTG